MASLVDVRGQRSPQLRKLFATRLAERANDEQAGGVNECVGAVYDWSGTTDAHHRRQHQVSGPATFRTTSLARGDLCSADRGSFETGKRPRGAGKRDGSLSSVCRRPSRASLSGDQTRKLSRLGKRWRMENDDLGMMCGCVVPEDELPPVKTKIRRSRRGFPVRRGKSLGSFCRTVIYERC
jgi:hypothetical protein